MTIYARLLHVHWFTKQTAEVSFVVVVVLGGGLLFLLVEHCFGFFLSVYYLVIFELTKLNQLLVLSTTTKKNELF